MTVLGKILAFLVLVFALLIGGLLVVDFATRNNWAEKYKKAQDELAIARANSETVPTTFSKYDQENKALNQKLATAQKDLIDAQELKRASDATNKIALDAAELRAKDADLSRASLQAENERFNKENQGLLVVLTARDKTIVAQQADIVKFRNHAVAEESARKATQDRLDQSLGRIAELERDIAKKSERGAGGDVAAIRGKPNPPTVYVEGKIDSIHPQDTGLVQLTVGSDKGLKQNQTLEVYRTEPQPLYLGTIHIVDVSPHTAVGRLERLGTARGIPLRVGDTVSSTLIRN